VLCALYMYMYMDVKHVQCGNMVYIWVCLLVVVRCAGCAEVEVVQRTRDGGCYTDPVTPRHLPV
jgi:hypothetical protein